MNKINYGTGSLLTCVFEILVGILLLIDPVGFTSAIIVIFGVALVAFGAVSLFRYFRADAAAAAQGNGLSKGLIVTVLGIFCVFKTEWFFITFPLLTVLYGVLTLLSGAEKVQWTVDMLRTKQKYWFVEAIGAALTIVCAILILTNPFASTEFLWTFIGITLIVEAIVDVTAFALGKKEA